MTTSLYFFANFLYIASSLQFSISSSFRKPIYRSYLYVSNVIAVYIYNII